MVLNRGLKEGLNGGENMRRFKRPSNVPLDKGSIRAPFQGEQLKKGKGGMEDAGFVEVELEGSGRPGAGERAAAHTMVFARRLHSGPGPLVLVATFPIGPSMLMMMMMGR